MLLMIAEIIILFVFLLATLLCISNSREYLKTIDKQEHKLYFLYPLADRILDHTGMGHIVRRKNSTADAIKALNVNMKSDQQQRLFWCSKISLVIIIIIFFNLLSLLSSIMNSNNSEILNEKYLRRPGYGEGTKEVELKVTMKQAKGQDSKKDVSKSKDVSISVEERIYTKEELEIIFSKAIKYLENKTLGENKSADEIYSNLNFISSIPGTGISVDWESENYDLIDSDGTVKNEKVNKKGNSIKITAILNYQKQQTKHYMSFRVLPKQYSDDEVMNEKLSKKLSAASKETSKNNLFQLPDTLGNYHLIWQDKKKNNGFTLWFMGIFLAVVAWFMGDKELEKKMKQRKDQMLLDYPELINKFTLLVNAGMTIRQAWIKITEDYSTKLRQEKGNKHYAYEEMLTTANELKLGLSENIAYEQYGRRIGLIPYIKFSSLITQNLKKGNKGFTELLMKEAMEAFEERKEVAKRLGEEAGTKLLIPMMLMLLMILLIIIIPAFWAFQM